MLLLTLSLACGLSGNEPAGAPVEVVTVVVIATDSPPEEPLPGEPVTSSEEELPVVTDAPALEIVSAQSGQPVMTALVDLNVQRGPGIGYEIYPYADISRR